MKTESSNSNLKILENKIKDAGLNDYLQLDGLELKGQYILEIPASNATLSNIKHYEEIAKEYNVILRFMEEIK